MSIVTLIARKRRGEALTPTEIEAFVQGFTRGEIPDYQAAAWLMAVCCQGMTSEETTALTLAMARSGRQIDLGDLADRAVDKHSSGGIGDKTTLVVAPLVAAAGLPVAKMSGRGLGFTGGTIDKLESIPGFRTALSPEEFVAQVRRLGLAVARQTPDLVPADAKLYALRDVTATVDCPPLIASSIMSKKIAGGARHIVLDVKVGSGAFLKTLPAARDLAGLMVTIGRQAGRRVAAVLSAMDQPLGGAVGNALEVAEAVATLRGAGPADLRQLALTLGRELLLLAGAAPDPATAEERLAACLDSGAAYEKFCAWVAAQGGDVRAVQEPERLPRAPHRQAIRAPTAGWVTAMDGEAIGWAAVALGAGRTVKDAPIDPAVGFVFRAKIGDRVAVGETLAEVHARTPDQAEQAARQVIQAITIVPEPVSPPPLVHTVLR